ncbi:MAG: potassium channel family protein [Acidobacteriota bacterium]|nr:potassium channel family protein [Acidobacteriota bacterium]
MQRKENARKRKINRERLEILEQLESWLETPLLVLSFVWLVLFIVEQIYGLTPLLDAFNTTIWIIFIADFAVKFTLAPHKIAYLKTNWLTAIALALPALRVFRIFRVAGILRAARVTRGLRLVRVLTSLNRGMKTLGASLGRRGLPYIVALSAIVTLAGGAGIYALENETENGIQSYGEAVWWTAMILTTMGSDFFPKTGEGRILCFVLAVYGFCVFGYITASLASFFIERDAGSQEAEIIGTQEIAVLRAEIAALRAEIGVLTRRQS